MSRLLFVVTSLLLLCSHVIAQEMSFMETVKSQGRSLTAIPDSEWKGKDASTVVADALHFIQDENDEVSSVAVELAAKAALYSSDLNLRKRVVRSLCGCLFIDAPFTATKSMNYLSDFSSSDYDEESVKTIERFLTDSKGFNYTEVARMAVTKGIGLEQLAAIYHNEKMSVSKRWDIAISLSRLDYQDAVDWLVSHLAKAQPDGEFVENLVPDLVFTRNRMLIEYCIKLLLDTNLKCSSANPNVSKQVDCGSCIMSWLAPAIRNYPVQFDSLGMLQSDKDYIEALDTVRKWFAENEDYEIIKE